MNCVLTERRAGEHGLSGSLSTPSDLHVYPKEVHDFEKSPEGSPFPSYLRVTTEVSVAKYPIPAQREEHELSGSPSTRREARASSTSCTSPITTDIMSLT